MWIKDAAANFAPDSNTVTLASGRTLTYDYLVVCPGLVLKLDAIKGLRESLGANGVCTNYAYDQADYTWEALKNIKAGVPFMLSGGLDADNVAKALRITRAPGVDVSSGVERGPGEKDPEKIRAFIRAARAAEAEIFSPPLQLGEGSIVRPVK